MKLFFLLEAFLSFACAFFLTEKETYFTRMSDSITGQEISALSSFLFQMKGYRQ